MKNDQIKIKDVEGNPTLLTQFFKDNNCDLNKYINPEAKPIKTLSKWYVLIATIVFCILCGILFIHPLWSDILINILKFCALVVGLLCVFFVYMHFHETTAAIFAFVIFTIIIVVAYHIISPEEASIKLKNTTDTYIEQKLN